MFRVTSARREGSSRTAAPCPTPPTGPVARLFIRLALALMLALGLAAPAAAVTLVTNVQDGTVSTSTIRSTSGTGSQTKEAQGFITGATAYTLTSVQIPIDNQSITLTSLTAALHEKHATSDEPGDKVADLTLQGTITANRAKQTLTYNAPANTNLATETTYFLVLTVNGEVGVYMAFDDEDTMDVDESTTETGLAGWTIHDTHHRFDGTNWETTGTDQTGYNPWQIKLEGTLTTADETAPTFSSAEVTADAPKVMVLTFDEALADDSTPAASAFTVKVGGSAVSGLSVSSVGIDGTDATKVNLGLSVALDAGQSSVTIDYTNPGSSNNPLQDASDNEVATFTGQSVTNNAPACPDTTNHPGDALWTACLTLGQASGRVGYGQVNSYGALDPSSFTEVNDFVVTQLSQNTSMFYLALATSDLNVAEYWVLQVGDTTLNLADATLTNSLFSWTRPAALNWDSANIVDNAFIGDKVTVSLTLPDVTAPTVTGAEVAADAPDVMVLTFDEALDTGSVPDVSAFTVWVDGSDGPDVTAVAIDSTDATQVRLTLAAAVDAAQTSVTVDYTNPGMANDPLRDIVGNEVASFTDQTVVSASSSGLVFTPETVEVTEGGQARYTVALDAAPVADVIVSIVSDDEGAATVSPATLTFTPTDWDSAQEVTVTGVDDGVDGDDRTVTITHSGTGVETGTVSVTVTAESILEAPRREEATVLLRRHVDRFASVSSGAALGRLQGLAPPTTVNAQISARNHKLDASWNGDGAKSSGWAGWSRLFYGWVEGPGDGAIYDLYLGVDWRAPDGRYVIGGLLGHEGADLRLDEGGRFRSQVTQVGLYGATYLSDALILDGALAYGFGRPELSQGGVTAKYDTERFTIRADLTGGISWREGAVVIEPQAGLLHVQEELGAFEDSTGAPGAAETLRLTRFGVGPRLTWALPGGVFTGRARLNWDRHNLDGDGDKVSDLSASLDARLRYDLEGGLSAEFFGAADGIGLSGDQQTYTAGVSVKFRF